MHSKYVFYLTEDILDPQSSFVEAFDILRLMFFFVVSYFKISLGQVDKVITSRKKNNTVSEILIHLFLSCLSYFIFDALMR